MALPSQSRKRQARTTQTRSRRSSRKQARKLPSSKFRDSQGPPAFYAGGPFYLSEGVAFRAIGPKTGSSVHIPLLAPTVSLQAYTYTFRHGWGMLKDARGTIALDLGEVGRSVKLGVAIEQLNHIDLTAMVVHVVDG